MPSTFFCSRRTFEYASSRRRRRHTKYRAPGAKKLGPARTRSAFRLEAMKRGRTCKLFVFRAPTASGSRASRRSFKREGLIEKTDDLLPNTGPEKYDVPRHDQARRTIG